MTLSGMYIAEAFLFSGPPTRFLATIGLVYEHFGNQVNGGLDFGDAGAGKMGSHDSKRFKCSTAALKPTSRTKGFGKLG